MQPDLPYFEVAVLRGYMSIHIPCEVQPSTACRIQKPVVKSDPDTCAGILEQSTGIGTEQE